MLGIRQRQGIIARHRTQGRLRRERSGLTKYNNVLGDIRYSRCLKEAMEGYLDLCRFTDAQQELISQEGVSSQLEEVIVNSHTVETEHLRPERGQHLLRRRARDRRPPVA